MPRNSSGGFTLDPAESTVVSGNPIQSTGWAVPVLNDIADALSKSIAYDGQTTPIANLTFGGFRAINLGNATTKTDAVNAGQIASGALIYLTGVAGTNTITANCTPAITAYTAGQRFYFIPPNTNTGPVTININGVGAKSITRNGASALISSDLIANAVSTITFDGTQFQLEAAKPQTTFLATNSTNTGTGTINLVASGLSAIDYNELVIVFNGTSLSGTNFITIQLADQISGFIAAGYLSRTSYQVNATLPAISSVASGFGIATPGASASIYGAVILSRQQTFALPGADSWAINGTLFANSPGAMTLTGGLLPLTNGTPAGKLDGVRLAASGANTFNAGSVYMYGRT